jgi:hypothetical protein
MRYILLVAFLVNSFSVFSQDEIIVTPGSSYVRKYPGHKKQKRDLHFTAATNLQVDILKNDFSAFDNLLGSYNTELMNNSVGTVDIEFNGFINNWMAGINYGSSMNSRDYNDSLDLDFITTNFGLVFGYRILESKRFIIVPKINLKWNHYRLINSDNTHRIPVSQYVEDRDLDIRFNQLTAAAGLRISYKIYKGFPWIVPYDHMSIGMYGGYVVQINRNPWIYAVRNRLMTNNKININHLNLGVSFTFYID